MLPARRSIPAHAGEPRSLPTTNVSRRVYPRPRGGTRRGEDERRKPGGLSPPTRGNPRLRGAAPSRARSIPAHAGEPATSRRGGSARAIYPRPRGGTARAYACLWTGAGLSPPTRGNRPCRPCRPSVLGSIPAHAGEPRRRTPRERLSSVYPRPRGGTFLVGAVQDLLQGLSPPTRGNLPVRGTLPGVRGSIPAHAGEPGHPLSSA